MSLPNVCGLSWSRNVRMTWTQLAMRLALLGDSWRAPEPIPFLSLAYFRLKVVSYNILEKSCSRSHLPGILMMEQDPLTDLKE